MKLLIRTATALVLMNAITGCSTATAVNQEPAKVQARKPWFCQTGEENEAWDCVQSEPIARPPEPSRHPPQQVKRELPIQASPAVESRLSTPNKISAVPAPPRTTAVIPIAASDPAPVEAPRKLTQTSAAPETVPQHVRLAYRPEKAVAIIDLPADFWAVQLIALSSKEALEAFANANDIRGMSAARIATGSGLFYVLLLGVYETRALATQASTDLPPPFDNPWIRSLGSLQKGMLEADRVAENNTP